MAGSEALAGLGRSWAGEGGTFVFRFWKASLFPPARMQLVVLSAITSPQRRPQPSPLADLPAHTT